MELRPPRELADELYILYRAPGQEVDRMNGKWCEALSIQWDKLAAKFHLKGARFCSAVGDCEAPGGGVRIGNPILGNYVYVAER